MLSFPWIKSKWIKIGGSSHTHNNPPLQTQPNQNPLGGQIIVTMQESTRSLFIALWVVPSHPNTCDCGTHGWETELIVILSKEFTTADSVHSPLSTASNNKTRQSKGHALQRADRWVERSGTWGNAAEYRCWCRPRLHEDSLCFANTPGSLTFLLTLFTQEVIPKKGQMCPFWSC